MVKKKTIAPITLKFAFQHLSDKQHKDGFTLAETISTRAVQQTAFVNKQTLLRELKSKLPIDSEKLSTDKAHALYTAETFDNADLAKSYEKSIEKRREVIVSIDKDVAFKQAHALMQASPAHEAVQEFIRELDAVLLMQLDEDAISQSIKQFTRILQAHSDDFSEGLISLPKFKELCAANFMTFQSSLPETLNRAPKGILEHLTNALRVLFNALDNAISMLLGSETMASTATPLAHTLTGRNHFFNRPSVNIQERVAAFALKLEHLDEPAYNISAAI